MSRYTSVLALWIVCILGAFPAFAAEDDKKEKPKKYFEIRLDEVVVSEPLRFKVSDATKPVNVLSGDELRMKVGNTLGETIKLEMGVHNQSFGPGAGQPVIRGQSGPRVRVLSNGIGVNDASQISPDHAVATVPLLSERIEILRGPATLLYGSGAIGGMVNVIDGRIPETVPDKLFKTTIEQRFDTVANETSTALKIEGGKDYFAYYLDGFYQERSNLRIGGEAIDVGRAQVSEPGLTVTENSHRFIRNSDADSIGGSAGFSFVGDKGYFGISVNRVENNYGIPPSGEAGGEFARIEMQQNKFDLKGEWKKPIDFFETIRARLGYTDYKHEEVALDAGEREIEGKWRGNTYEARVEAPHKEIAGFRGVLGFHLITNKFSALKVEDNEALIPRTRTNTYALFAQESLDIGPVNTQYGIRVERTTVNPEMKFASRDFTPVSASASALWQVDSRNAFNIALTRSERAPQVFELYFEGEHHPTRTFQVGNPNLDMETSVNLDIGYQFTSDWFVAEVDLFHNWVDDYIFLQRTGNLVGGDPEVVFFQDNAKFLGYETRLIFPLLDNRVGMVDLTLFSDYTRGRLINRDDVPLMPPLRWGFQVDYTKGNWASNLRFTRGQAQNNTSAFESDTPGYNLLNLSTQYKVTDYHGANVMLFARANNLLNENIRNSASFLRNFAPEPGRGGMVGVRISY